MAVCCLLGAQDKFFFSSMHIPTHLSEPVNNLVLQQTTASHGGLRSSSVENFGGCQA